MSCFGQIWWWRFEMEEDDQSHAEVIIWPAEIVRQLAPVFEMSTTGLAVILGMSRHRVWRQIHRRQSLSAEDQQRVLGAIRVYTAALELCGLVTPEQRAQARYWMNDWLRTPRSTLRNQCPLELMRGPKGQEILVIYLSRIRHGVYT